MSARFSWNALEVPRSSHVYKYQYHSHILKGLQSTVCVASYRKMAQLTKMLTLYGDSDLLKPGKARSLSIVLLKWLIALELIRYKTIAKIFGHHINLIVCFILSLKSLIYC